MILTRSEASVWRAELEAPMVLTNGVFEFVHPGHIRYLNQARAFGGYLLVGVNSDESARRLGKGAGRPFVRQDDRAEVVSSLRMVDCVVVFDDDTPAQLISELKPDVLVKGGDYDARDMPGGELVTKYGGQVVTVGYEPEYSSTMMIRRIRGES